MATSSQFIEKVIGPKEAQVLLEKNTRNRRINKMTVRKYAKDMTAGKWDPDADTPIKIATDGSLLDGQHRLLAVVESGEPQTFTFRTGCNPASQQHMDRGRKRMLSDDLDIHGYKYTTLLSAAISNLSYYLENGKFATSISSVDFEDAIKFMDRFPGFEDLCAHAQSRVSAAVKQNGSAPLVSSEAAILLFLTSQTEYADLAEDFLNKLLFGSEEENHPCNAFKREIVREKNAGRSTALSKQYLYGLAFSAWNKYIKNETVKYLRPPKDMPKLIGFKHPDKVTGDSEELFESPADTES